MTCFATSDLSYHVACALVTSSVLYCVPIPRSLYTPAMPGSFKGAVHAICTAPNYSSVVRGGVVGGDMCSRTLVAGTCVAAKEGLDAIPVDWIKKTTAGVETLQLAVELAKL